MVDKDEYEKLLKDVTDLKEKTISFIDTSNLLANISDIQTWTTSSSYVNTSYTAIQNCEITG